MFTLNPNPGGRGGTGEAERAARLLQRLASAQAHAGAIRGERSEVIGLKRGSNGFVLLLRIEAGFGAWEQALCAWYVARKCGEGE